MKAGTTDNGRSKFRRIFVDRIDLLLYNVLMLNVTAIKKSHIERFHTEPSVFVISPFVKLPTAGNC